MDESVPEKESKVSIHVQYTGPAVPLECMGSDSRHDLENFSDLDSDEDDVNENKTVVKAKFNQWKGQELDLYLLGPFKSEFDRNIKSLVRPEMVTLKLDPFYRNEYPDSGEPGCGKVYRIWKNTNVHHSNATTGESSAHLSNKGASEPFSEENANENFVKAYVDEDNEDDSHFVGYAPLIDEFSESETESEIGELVESLRIKRKEGKNVTGESLWYDESNDMIRNLHKQSYSLTSYIPPDNNLYGKGKVMQSILTPEELKMLQPMEIRDDTKNDTILDIG